MGMPYIYNTYEEAIKVDLEAIKVDLEAIKVDLEELPENLKNTLNGRQSQPEQEESEQREGEGNEEVVAWLLNYAKIETKDYNKLIELFKKKTTEIRNLLGKYLQSQNLSFLIGNGCSLYAGSKSINTSNTSPKTSSINKILDENEDMFSKEITNSLKEKKLEELLNVLSQIENYYKVIDDQSKSKKISEIISKVKNEFLLEYVCGINYANNEFHRQFLKKIIARDTNKSRVKIFTLNYDLIIEKAAEELGIIVNNGFIGFILRKFDPSVYEIDYHIKKPEMNRPIPLNKSINLYKLHGSISWFKHSEEADEGNKDRNIDYEVVENQPIFYDNGGKVKFSESDYLQNSLIYPTYTKIAQSFDSPYGELFRHFTNALNSRNSTLIVIGYSFSDEHVNKIIENALTNPDFNLLIFSFESSEKSETLRKLFERGKKDSKITIFYGKLLGDFRIISSYLLPYVDIEEESERQIQ